MVYHWLKNKQFWPRHCLLCRTKVKGSLPLCDACAQDLPWLPAGCARCALPLVDTAGGNHSLCGRCQQASGPGYRSQCLFHYEYPLNRLIGDFKFNGQLAYGRLLGMLLAQHIAGLNWDLGDKPEAVMAVPLHNSRLRERGFNQAVELARPVSKALGVPLQLRGFIRQRPTLRQQELSARQRRHNLRNAFRAAAPCPTKVLLIDDVMTTGTTINEAVETLLRAGAEEVRVFCVARAS